MSDDLDEIFRRLTERIDVQLANHGSVSMLTPRSEAAKVWVAENLPADAMTFGDAIVIEHRFVEGIASGMLNAGLSIEYRRRPTAH